jgi:hypothetical protein
MHQWLKSYNWAYHRRELKVNRVNISTRMHRTSSKFNYYSHARLQPHQNLPHLGFYHNIQCPNIHTADPYSTNGPPKPNFPHFIKYYTWGMYQLSKPKKNHSSIQAFECVSASPAPTVCWMTDTNQPNISPTPKKNTSQLYKVTI